jgi:hypothetical protein
VDALAGCSIAQLCPAGPGWHARYRQGSHTVHRAVALWALVDAGDGIRRIVGIAPDEQGELSCHAEEVAGFERYVYLSPGTIHPPGP